MVNLLTGQTFSKCKPHIVITKCDDLSLITNMNFLFVPSQKE